MAFQGEYRRPLGRVRTGHALGGEVAFTRLEWACCWTDQELGTVRIDAPVLAMLDPPAQALDARRNPGDNLIEMPDPVLNVRASWGEKEMVPTRAEPSASVILYSGRSCFRQMPLKSLSRTERGPTPGVDRPLFSWSPHQVCTRVIWHRIGGTIGERNARVNQRKCSGHP